MRTAKIAIPIKYRAFISYSHQDRAAAEWLHRALERYRLPRGFAGQAIGSGRLPHKLGPIFLDRLDLAAGGLGTQIKSALDASEFLIVICSPRSKASAYVGDEIEEFKRLGRNDKILALITDGRPFDPACDCFPDAMKSIRSGSLHRPGSEAGDVLAADLQHDGQHLATLKLVAGLLGVSLDDLRRRDAVAERRRRRMWTGISGAMASLAAMSIGLALFAYELKELAEANLRLADRRHEQSIDIALQFAKSVAMAADDLQIPSNRARDLLDESGKVLNELSNVAGNRELAMRIKAAMDLNHTETSGRLSSGYDRERYAKDAQDGYRKLVELRPDSIDYQKGYGDASFQVGIALRDQGYLSDALTAFGASRAVREDLLRAVAPAGAAVDAAARRDLSAVSLQVAVVLKRQGEIEKALEQFSAALALRRGLAAGHPDDPSLRLDVTEALVEYADAIGFKGEGAEQLRILRDVVAIRRELYQARQFDTKYKRFLAWSLISLGEALLEAGQAPSALDALQEACGLMHDVRIADPKSLRTQKDMTWAEGHRSDALVALERLEEALAGYQRALELAEDTLKGDGASLTSRRNVAYWLRRQGKAERLSGRIEPARAGLDRALSFLRMDVSADPSNRMLRAELGQTYLERGRLEQRANRAELAAVFFGQARQTYAALSAEAPDFQIWAGKAIEAGHALAALGDTLTATCRGADGPRDCVAGWSSPVPGGPATGDR